MNRKSVLYSVDRSCDYTDAAEDVAAALDEAAAVVVAAAVAVAALETVMVEVTVTASLQAKQWSQLLVLRNSGGENIIYRRSWQQQQRSWQRTWQPPKWPRQHQKCLRRRS